MPSKKRILLNLPNADRLSTRRLIGGILEEMELHPDLQTLILPYFSDRMRERMESGALRAWRLAASGKPVDAKSEWVHESLVAERIRQ